MLRFLSCYFDSTKPRTRSVTAGRPMSRTLPCRSRWARKITGSVLRQRQQSGRLSLRRSTRTNLVSRRICTTSMSASNDESKIDVPLFRGDVDDCNLLALSHACSTFLASPPCSECHSRPVRYDRRQLHHRGTSRLVSSRRRQVLRTGTGRLLRRLAILSRRPRTLGTVWD